MASTYLSRTPSGNNNSVGKWTYSFWIKRNSIGVETNLISFYTDTNNRSALRFDADDKLRFYEVASGATTVTKLTNRLFRDVSAWYHIMLAVDKTLGSPETEIYVNGVEETSFATDDGYTQNQTGVFNNAIPLTINTESASVNNPKDITMTHVHFTDGNKYAPTVFGEFNSTSGIWIPKTNPSVTYGTNGFFLKFENSANMGLDSSGNSNNFTVTGTLTQNIDTPSNNFATMNTNQSNIASVSNGNLTATTSNYQWALATLAANTGKWYVEMKVTHGCMVMGIQDIGKANDRLTVNNTFWYSGSQSYHLDGFSRVSHDSYGDIANDASAYPTYGSGDIIMMAVNLTDNKLAYGKNGTWYNSTNPGSGNTNMISIDAASTNENGNYGFVFADTCGASDGTFNINFGQGFFGTTAVASANADGNGFGAFEYTVPTGYYALCTKNIKEFG